MHLGIIISLGIYFVGMLAIGYWSFRKTTDVSDYMLGGRGLGPAVTALSAGASDMSSWLVMGLPGALFSVGLSKAWIAIGLVGGAYLNYLLVAPRLRVYTEIANNSITIPDYFENRFNDKTKLLRFISGIFILIFFTLYASVGLVSGGELFKSSFGMSYTFGIFLTAAVVVAYTLFGGFLAVSTTDFVQGCIMFLALILVPIVVISGGGGTTNVLDTIKHVDPTHFNFLEGMTGIAIVSSLSWGLGYFGQPHIIVRFMAITSLKEIKVARRIGMGWMIVSVIGAMMTGFFGYAYYKSHGLSISDPETIFIELANLLFNPYITGFLLAAVLAAIMSTISSQLLVTASSVTEDFYKTFFRRHSTDKERVLIGRLAVLGVAIVAMIIAYSPNDTILGLVSHAWAGFGAAFGPVVLVSLFWRRMTMWGAFAGIVVGGLTVIFWLNITHLGLPHSFTQWATGVYEMVPGFILSMVMLFVVSLLTAKPCEKTTAQFDELVEKMGA